MAQSPEVQAHIQALRNKQRLGTLTLDEMKQAVIFMRGDRNTAAASAGTRTTKKAKGPVRSADDLLSELDNL